MNFQQTILKIYFGTLSFFAPSFAAKKGFVLFQKVRKKSIRPRETSFFNQATGFQVEVELDKDKYETIDCYALGNQEHPLVVLVHGWDSNAGSMSQIANRLVADGKYVVLFNLPGHAFSKTSSTNLLECKRAVIALLENLNPKPGFSMVSHSFGSAVVSYALSKKDYKIDKLVFLTNPNKIDRIFTEFKNFIGLGNKAYSKLLKLTEEKLGEPIEVVGVASSLAKINFDQLLLVHDKNDKVLPYYNSLEVLEATPNTQLKTFENVGHYKMLWNKDIIDQCANFLQES